MKRLYSFPKINLVVIFGITLFFLLQLPKLELDNEVMNFIPANDHELVALEDFSDQYGSVMIMALVIHNPYDSILKADSLNRIGHLTELLEELPYVEEIQSISNMDYISGAGGQLNVMPLSKDEQGLWLSEREILGRIRDWDMYDNVLISGDSNSTLIGITMERDLEVEQQELLYRNIHSLTKEILPAHYNYYLAGLPSTTLQVSENIRADLKLLIPFVSLLVLLILYLSFHRIGGVILPLMNVAVSTIWTLGLMALLRFPLTILGSIIPILLIAVGSAYGIHLISHYYDEQNQMQNPGRQELQKMVLHSVKVVGLPIIMAGVTTIAGFGALSVSSVLPMRSFGIFTAIGVASALILSLTMIPSLLLLKPGRPSKSSGKNKENLFLRKLMKLNVTRRGLISFISLFLLFAAIIAIPRINIDNDITLYFKEETPIRQAEAFMGRHFTGTNSFDIRISGSEKGDLNHPDILEFMDRYKMWMEQEFTEISKVVSYSDFIKRINQVLHEDSPGRMSLLSSTTLSSEIENLQDQNSSQGSFFNDDAFEDDSGFFDSDASFADDSFEGDSFVDDSFGADSFYESEDNLGFFEDPEVPSSKNNLEPNSSDQNRLMDTLWSAYQEDPDGFMLSLARLTNHKGFDYYEIPGDPAKYGLSSRDDLSDLIAQYLILFSGNLDSWSNEAIEPSEARMSVQLRENGTRFTGIIQPELKAYADLFLPEGYEISFSGTALVQGALTNRIVRSMILSIIVSILLVFLILSFTYRSPLAGLIGIVPLSLTVLVNFGVMGLTGIRLDISTAMVGSIAIGIGIDYTIHFLSSYCRFYRPERKLREVTAAAMHSSGKAILFNALSVAAGFAVLVFSRFNPLMYFGLLIVITMAVSSLASLTLLPLLLNSLKPRFLKKNYEVETPEENEDETLVCNS